MIVFAPNGIVWYKYNAPSNICSGLGVHTCSFVLIHMEGLGAIYTQRLNLTFKKLNFTHIPQGCFTGTGAITRLPQCQWSNLEGYGQTTNGATKNHPITMMSWCTVYSGADKKKTIKAPRVTQLCEGNSPHKGPATRWCFHLMMSSCHIQNGDK